MSTMRVSDTETQKVIRELEAALKKEIRSYLSETATGDQIIVDLARIEKLAHEIQKWMLI